MRSVGRGLTAVGAGTLLLAACAGPAEVPVIEAAEEAIEELDEDAADADEADAAGDEASSTGDDTAGTDAGEESEEPDAPDPDDDAGSEDVGAARTPVPDPDLVAAPCAAHEGRELEPFLDLVAPVEGQAAGEELALVGCSNVYEATVNWRLLDAGGGVLDDGFTTAECGTGCVGAFRDTVPLTSAVGETEVTLQVFWISPQDGADTDLQERTVALG